MINTQIRSHWLLAFRAVNRAIRVTCSIAVSSLRAKAYIIKNSDRLIQQRRDIDNKILASVDEYWDRNL